MALSSQLSRFKAPGTKILTEVVESVPSVPAPQGARLLFINSKKGPVNHPILVPNFTTYEILFDKISDVDERRGNWGARSAEFMLAEGPIYVMNIRAFDNSLDQAGLHQLSTQGDIANIGGLTVPYKSLYSTSQFWKVDPKRLILSANTSNLLALGNVGSTTLSVFIRKTQTNQTSLTFDQWYKNLNREIPAYVNPDDKVSDWMVDVVIFNNKFDATSSSNPSYGHIFNVDGSVKKSVLNQSNLQIDGLAQLAKIPESGYLDTITGSLVQQFTDEYNNNLDVVSMINSRVQEFGLVAKLNDNILDTQGSWVESDTFNSDGKKKPVPVDFLGHNLCHTTAIGTLDVDAYDSFANVKSLSYAFDVQRQEIVFDTTFASVDTINAGTTMVQHSAIFEGVVSGVNIELSSKNTLYVSEELKAKLGDKYVAQDGNLATVTKIEYQGLVNDVKIYKLYFDKNLCINNSTGQSVAVVTAPITDDADSTITFDDSSEIKVYTSTHFVHKVLSYDDVATKFEPIQLESYVPRTAQFTDGTSQRQNEILDVLINSELRGALSNNELLKFNYVVDGFKSFVEPNCKAQLKQVAEDRILCRAICNTPSIYDFERSTNPYFKDSIDGEFNAKWIAQGGNTELPYTNRFTLPNENGWYAYFYGPNIQLSNGKTMPPAALVSNLFARKYKNSKPYAILAGSDGVLAGSGVSGVEYVFNEKNDGTGDRDYLDPMGYNVILIKNGILQVYGNKTANTTVANPMMAIHTSEVVMYIQERIKSLLERFVFKYNNAQNRLVIREEANSICNEPLGDGAISNYVNQIDELNNTNEVVKNRIGILDTTIYDNSGMEILVHRTKIDSITNTATFEILSN